MAARAALLMLLAAAAGGAALAASPPPYDVIVVGLGAAGTTAATTLARAGRRVLALEAQPRVGGRVWTAPAGDGVVELGAEWIHGLHPSRVYELAVANNVSVLLQDLQLAVYRSDGAGRDQQLTDLIQYCNEALDDGSDRPESVAQLAQRKLKEYLQQNKPELAGDEALVSSVLDLVDRMTDTLESSSSYHQVSAQDGYENLNGSLYGSWHRHGYKTFFDILLNKYNGGEGLPSLEVQLNKEVTNIRWSADDVTVRCADGAQYSAPHAVVTVSLGVLKERHAELFSPPLPPEKVSAIEGISMGVLGKVVLVFERPWPADGSVMFYWTGSDVARLPAEDRWLTRFAGTSPPAGASRALTLWVAGDDAKFVETLSDEVLQSKVLELLQRFVGRDVTLPRVVTMLRSSWYSNRFTRGSYTYDNVDTPRRPGLRAALAAPLPAPAAPRLLFAGEATAPRSYGTVHGASDTGHREAQRLLRLNS